MVPKPSKLMAWAQEKGLDGDLAKVCSSQEATRAVLESLTKTGREGGLHGFEIIKALYLEPEAFDVDKGLMTPTFKFKRPQLLKHYKRQVDTMYAAISSHQ